MNDLHALVRSLSKPQVKLLRSYLTGFSVRKDENTRFLQLFDYLLAQKDGSPSKEETAAALYDKPNMNTYERLKNRFKFKVYDVLTLDLNIDRRDRLDEVDYVSIRLKKKFLQFQVLYRLNGNNSLTRQLLEEIITQALKFEVYEVLLAAMRFRKYFKGFCKGLNDFKAVNRQIAYYDYAFAASLKANDLYYQLIMWDNFNKGSSRQKKQDFIKEAILDLKKDLRYSRSAMVGYYLKLMEMAYFEEEGEYGAARQASLEMLDLLKENKSVFRKQRLGITFLNLSLYDVHLKNFVQAISNARAAVKFFPSNSANYFIGKEQEFLSGFYGNMSEYAHMALNELLKAGKKEHGNFRVDKYNYYRTCLLFREGKPKEAMKELNTHMEISRDKTGWEISVRVLAIMCNIELERFDEAALLVENLRKHAERNKKGKQELSARDAIIVKVLVDLSRKGFMFSALNEKTLLLLGRLAGTDKKQRWQPFGAELIPFHEWMIAKIPARSGTAKMRAEKAKQKSFDLMELQRN